MRILLLLLFPVLATLRAADAPPAKPGFLKRIFNGTKDGADSAWSATRSAGRKTVEVVKSPFARKGAEETPAAAAWKNIAVTMKIEPAEVRLPETRALDVTVSVVNSGKTAVQLEFPNSLRLEVVVKADGGRVVSRWSDDQRIENEPGILVVNPKERLEYAARISTREMTAGKTFVIEAFFPSHERLRTSRVVTPRR